MGYSPRGFSPASKRGRFWAAFNYYIPVRRCGLIVYVLLSLCIIAGPGGAEPQPRIELPPNDTLEVFDPTVVQSGSWVLFSGRVKRVVPWGNTAMGSSRDIAF